MTSKRFARTGSLGALLCGVLGAGSDAIAAGPTKAACLAASADWADLREDRKLRAARDRLLLCAAASCPTDIREECSRHVPELTQAIPSIVFAAKDSSGNDVALVSVTIDGQPLLTKLDGSSIAIDPGEHTFRFVAPGQLPIEKKFVIQEGEKERRERIEFGADVPAKPSAVPPPPSSGAPPVERPLVPSVPLAPAASSSAPMTQEAPPGSGGGLGAQKILGVVAGALGAGGIAVGSVFGVMASSKWTTAKATCGAGCPPNDPAQNEKSDAQSAATVSTIGFVAGGALVATGLLLFVTAPQSSTTQTARVRVSPSVGPDMAGVTLMGGF
jgi:hypothetical protein